MLEVREVRCNKLVHEMTYRGSTGYTANLYKGSTHGCVYCYAPSLTHDERPWGAYVDVKVNAPHVIERELRVLERGEVFLSSASDPYQPVEAKYRITRRCLESLAKNKFPVSVLTRSPLVLRDLDVLKRFDWVKVGMSITTVPVRKFEPGVSPLRRRLDTLRRLSSEGIRTWVSLAPVIPGIMMVDLDDLFEELGASGVSFVSFGILRFTGYEESKRLFEATAGISTAEALAASDDVTARLSRLVREHRLEPKGDVPDWKGNLAGPHSLDGFL